MRSTPAAADRSLARGRAVGVDPAGTLLARVEVAPGERVALVAGPALADGAGAGGTAVGVDPAGRLGTRVEDAVDERVALGTTGIFGRYLTTVERQRHFWQIFDNGIERQGHFWQIFDNGRTATSCNGDYI